MNFFKRFKAMLRYKVAVNKANKAYQENGKRYYVLLNGSKGDLVIVDRINFRKMKHKKYFPLNMHIKHLEQFCVYHTPYADGSHPLSDSLRDVKRIQYINFVDKPKIKNK